MRVSGLARLLITVPLLTLSAASVGLHSALAAGSAAEEALRILTRAKTIEARCGFLSGAERGELSRYTARAEIAAASQASATAAKRAASAGKSEGNAADCSAGAKADVRDTLYAARVAIAKAGSKSPGQPDSSPRTATKDVVQNQDGALGVSGNALARYARVVEPYYLERQCRSLSKSEDGQFWRGIVRLHKAAVAGHGADKVAPLMRRAERRASRSTCSSAALSEIRQGYEETMSR